MRAERRIAAVAGAAGVLFVMAALPGETAAGGVRAGGAMSACRLTPVSAKPPTAYLGRLSTHWLQQGKLWMGFTRADKAFLAKPNGQKIGWWRQARGRLRVSGVRLDAESPPLRATIPFGYGTLGFQSSSIVFPTAGCWQVVAHLGLTRTSSFFIEVSTPTVR